MSEPTPLEPSDPPPPATFTQALLRAYYDRDREAIERIAHKVERELAQLRKEEGDRMKVGTFDPNTGTQP